MRGGGGFRQTLRRLAGEEMGQGLVEYIMVIALVAIGLLSVLQLFSGQVGFFIGEVTAALRSMVPR